MADGFLFGEESGDDAVHEKHCQHNVVGTMYQKDKLCVTEQEPGLFAYTVASHTSVVGMREIALQRGARVRAFTDAEVRGWRLDADGTKSVPGGALFAASAQCNFSGRKLALDWVSAARTGRICVGETGETPQYKWSVLLDAAAWAATSPLDLKAIPADFVTISFYKMFGLPTGLGALVARRESVSIPTSLSHH